MKYVHEKTTAIRYHKSQIIQKPNSCTIRLRLIRNQLDIVIELKSSLRIILARNKVDNQRILDGKHSVVFQVLIPPVKDLGCQGFVAVIGSL